MLHYKLVNAMKEQDTDKALAFLSDHIQSAIETYRIGMTDHLKAKAALAAAESC